VEFVLRIARGEPDALSGRFISVQDELATLAAVIDPGALTLRLVQPALASA